MQKVPKIIISNMKINAPYPENLFVCAMNLQLLQTIKLGPSYLLNSTNIIVRIYQPLNQYTQYYDIHNFNIYFWDNTIAYLKLQPQHMQSQEWQKWASSWRCQTDDYTILHFNNRLYPKYKPTVEVKDTNPANRFNTYLI